MTNVFEACASPNDIAMSIKTDGYAIIKDLLTPDLRSQLQSELAPFLGTSDTGHEDFMGHFTRRFGSLLAKCPMSQHLALQPLILQIVNDVLGPYCARFQLNYTGVMYIEPGEKTQVMHRDTSIYPIQNPAPPMILATMWAMTDFTIENGATRLVPGSHIWEDERHPTANDIVGAEMKAGSVLLYTGNIIHGAGANRANSTRGGLAIHYSLGWLRQEENQYLAMSLEEARELPRELQKLMGYDLGTVNLGFVDHKHPNRFLNKDPDDNNDTLGPQDLMDKDNKIQRMKVTGTSAVGRARFNIE